MSYDNDDNYKNIWCRSYYGMVLNKQGYNIIDMYPCKFGLKCRGAHKSDEIIEKHTLKKWKESAKGHINILEIKNKVIEILQKNKEMVQSTKYRMKILNINNMRIDELFTFWYDIFYYHHRISKELPTKKAWTNTKSKPSPIEGFNYKDDVPNFYIENDDLWAIERMLHMCPKFNSLDKTIKTSVKDICIGDINCKEGSHSIKDLICIDNFITGKCACISKEEYDIKTRTIIDTINELNSINIKDEDGFIQKTNNISKKKKDEIMSQLIIKKKELNELTRMYHMTEYGFIPLNVQTEIKNKDVPKTLEDIQVKKTTKIVKPKFT